MPRLAPERWTEDPIENYRFPYRDFVVVPDEDRVDSWNEEEDGPRNDDWIAIAYENNEYGTKFYG